MRHPRLRLWADLAVTACTVAALGAALALLVVQPLRGTDWSRYNASPWYCPPGGGALGPPCSPPPPGVCARISDSLGPGCRARILAVVTARDPRGGAVPPRPTLGVHVVQAGFVPAYWTLEIPHPTRQYYSARTGQRVLVTVWDARPVAVLPDWVHAAGTAEYPEYADALRLSEGFALLGIAIVLVAAVPPPPLVALARRLRLGERRDPAGAEPQPIELAPGLADYTLRLKRDAASLAAVAVFVCLQAADVATTVAGGQAGYFEANPLADAVLRRLGPALGLSLLKVPAIVALLVVTARLPRRLALAAALAASAAFVAVVVHNIALLRA